jgi:hypothetical protein
MAEIDHEIAAFREMQPDLEKDHPGKFVLIKQRKLIGVFDSFEQAADAAVRRFGRGPYLLRQVGAPPMTLPASVVYHPDHAKH